VTLRVNSLAGLILQRPGLSGPPWYTTWDRQAARQSLVRLARLRPAVVAGGHGEPMTGAGTAEAVSGFAGSADGRRAAAPGVRHAGWRKGATARMLPGRGGPRAAVAWRRVARGPLPCQTYQAWVALPGACAQWR
jgi:hypothetical protein